MWQNAIDFAMHVFELSKRFPPEEKYSLTDQLRGSSRSVTANIAEAWRKRRYEAAFINKLNDSESEAAETQTCVEFALRCHFLSAKDASELDQRYEQILGQLVHMIDQPESWVVGKNRGVRTGVSQRERGSTHSESARNAGNGKDK